MAESADALASGASQGNLVEVQVLLSAPNKNGYFDTNSRSFILLQIALFQGIQAHSSIFKTHI